MPRFSDLAARYPIALKRQPDGDLGARMLGAIAAGDGPTLVIGTDCPAFTPEHLARGRARRCDDADVVLIPAEDGGYVLIGARAAHPQLFAGIAWGTATVMARDARAHCRARPQSGRTRAAVGRRHREPTSRASSGSFRNWRFNYCSRISTNPHDDQQRGADAHRAQRLLEHDDRDHRAEQHAGLAQGWRRWRSAPASSPTARCRRTATCKRAAGEARAANSAASPE